MAVLRRIVALWARRGAGPASRTERAPRLDWVRRGRWGRWLRGWRQPRPEPAIDPTLPATAQIVAVQHPSTTLPERPYDLLLLVAVLGLLGIGTIEIYSATAADGLTRFHDAAYFLERQIGFLAIGGVAMWLGARIDYRRLKQ